MKEVAPKKESQKRIFDYHAVLIEIADLTDNDLLRQTVEIVTTHSADAEIALESLCQTYLNDRNLMLDQIIKKKEQRTPLTEGLRWLIYKKYEDDTAVVEELVRQENNLSPEMIDDFLKYAEKHPFMAQTLIFHQSNISEEVFQKAYAIAIEDDSLFPVRLVKLGLQINIAGYNQGELPADTYSDIFAKCRQQGNFIKECAYFGFPKEILMQIIEDYADDYPVIRAYLKQHGELFSKDQLFRAYRAWSKYKHSNELTGTYRDDFSFFDGLLTLDEIQSYSRRNSKIEKSITTRLGLA